MNCISDHHSKADLLVRFNHRENDAFCEVYQLYFNELHYFVKSLYNNPRIESEDLIHDAFMWLFQHREIVFESLPNVKAYIYTILKNGVLRDLNRLKSRQKYNDFYLETETLFEHSMIEAEFFSNVPKLLGLLPSDCAKILKLLLEGYSPDEVALKLGIQRRTVYNRKSEAINILKSKLSGNEYVMLLLLLAVK